MGSIQAPAWFCEDCSYAWLQRQRTPPVHCPKCRSTTWNASQRTLKKAGRPRTKPQPKPLTLAASAERHYEPTGE